ncbi:MAG: hypothetical protein DRN15_02635 [Thermoprotei archaeon]|nr:MAG: hypothetical protein DRM97_05830 [Thermoprotei archaeon]RLF24568.1 MAG: hypothetical protein DRN15_02635 [Thermoprotei archaeon]
MAFEACCWAYTWGASASEVKGVKRSHNAIWKWIPRFAQSFSRLIWLGDLKLLSKQDTHNPGDEIVYLHAAINPDLRRILLLRLYPSRSTLSVYAL